MIHMSQVKIPIERLVEVCPIDILRTGRIGREEEELVRQEVIKLLDITTEKITRFTIHRKSMDARKKQQIHYSYSVRIACEREEMLVRRYGRGDATLVDKESHLVELPAIHPRKRKHRPVIVGFGPAGMFAALKLAEAGFPPLVLERGYELERRQKEVDLFWQGGPLNPECNVQFGEGGAGAFSDGKLNTMVKDNVGRSDKVMQTFAEFGAPSEILYLQKPHIGTDRLKEVVRAIRNHLISLGVEFWFETRFEDILTEKKHLKGILYTKGGRTRRLPCEQLVLATGHSARDTIYRLHEAGVYMEQKAFAMGARLEHPQDMIGRNQYGEFYTKLPVADYKVTYQATGGRGVYSFCMCPGGYVVNASSEAGELAVNGMSYSDRAGVNANSAIVVTILPKDFGGFGPLAGVELQCKCERAAYLQAGGKIPVQLLGDFMRNERSTSLGGVIPQMKGEYSFGNVRELLPKVVGDAIVEAIPAFGNYIKNFDREDAVFSGIESRTSSPVRILRNEFMQSSIFGVYPCGEGAGYAGGITSAAIDGLRVAEKVLV